MSEHNADDDLAPLCFCKECELSWSVFLRNLRSNEHVVHRHWLAFSIEEMRKEIASLTNAKSEIIKICSRQ